MEIYVSTDVETDGPIPGENSMLSFGSAAYDKAGRLIDTFEANLFALPNAQPNEKTMAWWKTQPEAWDYVTSNRIFAGEAMQKYVLWLKRLPAKPVFVGYPAGFDFLFVYWYLIKFTGESPFSFSALDIKSYAMAKLGSEYRQTVKKNMPKTWFGNKPHTHKALDDAIEQGELFINILNWKGATHDKQS